MAEPETFLVPNPELKNGPENHRAEVGLNPGAYRTHDEALMQGKKPGNLACASGQIELAFQRNKSVSANELINKAMAACFDDPNKSAQKK